MAAKNLPVIGEAFLGSDPLVSKVARILVGLDTTDGVNDVILVGTALATLLTVTDTKFMITDIKFRIVVGFTASNDFRLGVNSSPSLYCGAATVTQRPAFNVVAGSGWQDLLPLDTSADTGQMTPASHTTNPLDDGVTFPATASASIVAFLLNAPTATVGDVEVFIFYVETIGA